MCMSKLKIAKQILYWRWITENGMKFVLKIDATSIRKWVKIFQIRISRAGLEVLGDPSGVKMAQDASWIASGAEFGDLLGSSCRQDGPSWAKMMPRWRYVGQLGHQDGQLGSSLGGVLANFSDLERNLSKNSGSVKTSVTMVFWLQIKESGRQVGDSWKLFWTMLAPR